MALRSMNGAFSLLRNRRQFAAGAAEVAVQNRSKDAGKKKKKAARFARDSQIASMHYY